MRIKIIGAGCPRCQQTEQNVFSACAELGVLADITHVWDEDELARYGAMGMPTIVVNEKVVVSGHVPTVHELKRIISMESGK